MNRAERRKLKELKFKKRLKFWANLKYPVKENSEWREAKSWTELRDHHEFRDQSTGYKRNDKEYNQKRVRKMAFKLAQNELEDINYFLEDDFYSYYKVNMKARTNKKTWR
jgi:hypothetical protein